MSKIGWIDVLKGIGILLVVIGHIWGGTPTGMIYIFHMPLFFFISGYLSKPTTEYKSYFIHKTKSLLVPYIVYLIGLYLIILGLPEFTTEVLANYLFRLIFAGNLLGGGLGVFWFVTCLFFTQQMMNFILSTYHQSSVIFFMFVFLSLSYLNAWFLPSFWFPWALNVVLATAPIYYIGYWVKNENINVNSFIIAIGALLVLVFTLFFPANGYDMKNNYYGFPLLTLGSSLVIIFGLKVLAKYFLTHEIVKKPFSEFGKASMVIMYLHQPIQIIINRNISDDRVLRIVLATVIPYLLYLLFKKNKYTDALLLGNY